MSEINHTDLIDRLGHTLAALVKYAPAAPETRAYLRARAGDEPPADATTYEQLAEWTLANVPSRGRSVSSTTTPATRPDRALTVALDWTGEEHGSTSYTRRTYGRSHVHYSTQDLIDLANRCHCVDDLLESVKDAAEEDADAVNVSYVDSGDTDFGDDYNEGRDWEEFEIASPVNLRADLLALIRTTPELNHLAQ